MVDMPADAPPTRPVTVLMVATDGRLLSHVPPVGRSDKVTLPPAQTTAGPAIVEGSVLTVIAKVVKQPPAYEYRIESVPGAMPDTTPDGSTMAIVPSFELQEPPVDVSDNAIMDPAQSV